MAISQVDIRKSAIEAVSALPTTQSVNDLLVHAGWVANFIQTGALPEVLPGRAAGAHALRAVALDCDIDV